METHFLPARPIRTIQQSRAVWSRVPSKKAVVFVHGFRGNAIDTWSRFDELLPEEPKGVGFDFVFYGYDAFHSELIASVGDFREFLAKLLTCPSELSNPALPVQARRADDHVYQEIILVGHSLGAVLIRFALLDLHKLEFDQLGKIRLVLFAPAHCGAYLSKLFAETISPIKWLNLFAALIKFKSPLIDQLLPDSKELRELEKRTNKALESDDSAYLVAERVFIARRENVVKNLTFCEDPLPITLEADHKSICKPAAADSPCLGNLVNLLSESEGAYAGGK